MNDRQTSSTIGIIGSGNIGSAFARVLARNGVEAIIANSRGPESLKPLVAEIGGSLRAGDRQAAAAQEIVLVAVPWVKVADALAGLPDFGGRILIDANNAVEAKPNPDDPKGPPLFHAPDLHGQLSSEVVAGLASGAAVVKAFNHLPAALVSADPGAEGGRRVLFYSSNHEGAKRKVGGLIERLGFFGVDLGTLSVGAPLMQFPGGPFPPHNFVKFG